MTSPSRFRLQRLVRAALAVLAVLSVWAGASRAQEQTVSPAKGFLSVEAFELRKEFVLRFDTIAERVGAGEVTVIDARNRARLEQSVGDWLKGKCPVEVDGKPLAMELDRVHFVRPDLEKGLVVEDREKVPASEALVGVVFAAALDGPPQRLRVIWEVFPADGSAAVVEAGARGQRAARKLTPENPELIWENTRGLAVPELLALPKPPEISWRDKIAINFRVLGMVLGAGVVMSLWAARRGRRGAAAGIIALSLLAGAAVAVSRTPVHKVTAEEADEISYALLRNIYHAFDYRRESDIYDTLARSASGDLLTKIYLEVQRSLQVETQGGARVRVTNVDLRKCELVEPEPAQSRGVFAVDCEWVAVGTVTHWGHTHDRVNRYRARLTIGPRDGEWRLLGLDLESEERI